MKTVIFTTLDKQLQKDWASLWQDSLAANYVNSPYWFLSVIKNFNYTDYLIIALYEKDTLVAIGGLIKDKRYGIDVYTLPPGDYVCGIPFLIDLKKSSQTKTFIKEVMKITPIFLDNVPESLVSVITKLTPDVMTVPYSMNYYLDLHKDASGNIIIPQRSKLMYRARKVENKFTLHSYLGNSKEAFTQAFHIDEQSRKQTQGYNVFSCEPIQRFYTILAQSFKKHFYTNILYFEKTPVVYEMGFQVGTTYFGSQIAFDEQYSKYAPGKVFVVRLMESLVAKGITRIDLGAGDSSLKRSLTDNHQQLYKVIISTNVVVRLYLTYLYQIKTNSFTFLLQHKNLYTMYRFIKRNILKNNL